MLIFFLILTGLSLLILIGGIVWTVVVSGETRRRSGPEVGAEMMGQRMARDAEGRIVAQRAFFKGKAVEVESTASFSFAEIKEGMMGGQWGQVLPILLAIAGFLGLFLFGSLSAWLGIEDKLIGGLIVIVAFYAIIRTLIAFARA
jgi:hypothetical protein